VLFALADGKSKVKVWLEEQIPTSEAVNVMLVSNPYKFHFQSMQLYKLFVDSRLVILYYPYL
jgi:hypothetical protein